LTILIIYIIFRENGRKIWKNILVSFLERNCSEVENMLLSEWNMKDALEVAREEGVGIGLEKAFALWESGVFVRG
jgi:hypothetical protein